MREDVRHPESFNGRVNAIHKCLQVYLNMFSNMSPSWYIYNTRDSCIRKGFMVSIEEMCGYFVLYRPEWKGCAVVQDGKRFFRL